MSQNLPNRSLQNFLFYVILTISYLRARTINRNVIITQRLHAAPVQANRDFFLAYWLYISTVKVLFLIYARVTSQSASSGSPLLGENPSGAIIKRPENKFGCTLLPELRSRDTGALPRLFILFWIPPKKSLLKSSHQKKYLPNFPTPKNAGMENFKPKKILRSSPSLGIRSTPTGKSTHCNGLFFS